MWYANSIVRKGLGMPRASTLGKIEKEIERLFPKDQLKLVEKLAHQLRKSGMAVKKEIDWKGPLWTREGSLEGRGRSEVCGPPERGRSVTLSEEIVRINSIFIDTAPIF